MNAASFSRYAGRFAGDRWNDDRSNWFCRALCRQNGGCFCVRGTITFPRATAILSRAARLAYRRPLAPADVKTLLTFFDAGVRDGGTFDAGIQFALERMLVDPDFLLRVYHQPADVKAATYRLSAEAGSKRNMGWFAAASFGPGLAPRMSWTGRVSVI